MIVSVVRSNQSKAALKTCDSTDVCALYFYIGNKSQ